MRLNSAAAAGYNVAYIRRSFLWLALHKFLRAVPFLILGAVLVAGAVNYVEQLPRERSTRGDSYLERTIHGAKLAAKAIKARLSVPPGDPEISPLPKAEIALRGDRIDALNSDLPASGRIAHQGLLKIEGRVYKANLRYRGDSINHWAFPQKSWRVRLGRGSSFRGMRTFNLYLPRTRNQIGDVLGYEMANRMGGLLVPDANLVQFRLNRQFDGTRLLLEQVDETFPTRRGLPPGRVFVGDTTTEAVYGLEQRANLFTDTKPWVVSELKSEKSTHPGDKSGTRLLGKVLDILSSTQDPYQLRNELSKYIDIEPTLRYMALLDIVGSTHIDNTHNQKWYLNPATGKFTPIVWDIAAYFWPDNDPVDLGSSKLFRTMLLVPEWRERKNAIIWEALHGSLGTASLNQFVTDTEALIRHDVMLSPFKLKADAGMEVSLLSNSEWKTEVLNLKRDISVRNSKIGKKIAASRAAYWTESSGADSLSLNIWLSMDAGLELPLLEVRVDAPEGSAVSLERFGLPANFSKDAVLTARVHNGAAQFEVQDRLYSGKITVPRPNRSDKLVSAPGVYRYNFRLAGGAKGSLTGVGPITARNTITGASIKLAEAHAALRASEPKNFWWMPERFEVKPVTKLQGEVHIKENLIVDGDLTIAPGARIVLAPNTSLIARGGKVAAIGSGAAPITFEGEDGALSWGVFAIQDSPGAELSNLVVKGGSEAQMSDVVYRGSVTLSNSRAALRNVRFDGSSLSAAFSRAQIYDSQFTEPRATALAELESEVTLNGTTFADKEPSLKAAIVKQPHVGGAEKEFRRILLSSNGPSSCEIPPSETVSKGLETDAGDGALWQAPRIVGKPYFVSLPERPNAFLDLYFDTPAGGAAKSGHEYRLRYRFDRVRCHRSYLAHEEVAGCWPMSVSLVEQSSKPPDAGGYTEFKESEFDFHDVVEIFGQGHPPPQPPWPLDAFIAYAQAGQFKGITALPAQKFAAALARVLPESSEFPLDPVRISLTDQNVQHLEILTPWGTGKDPQQAISVVTEQWEDYPVADYLGAVAARSAQRKKDRPAVIAQGVRVSVEMEPSLARGFEKELKRDGLDAAALTKAEAARAAFLADAAAASKSAAKSLAGCGLKSAEFAGE